MLKRIVFWVIIIVIFILASVGILIMSSGYRVNWQRMTLKPTSLIWLKGSEKNVTIYMDSKKVGKKLPLRINFVNQGWREIKITKAGYYDWTRSFHVDDGKAYDLRDVVLFRKNAKPETVSDKGMIDSLKYVVAPLNITVSNGELKARDELVTRLSSDPVAYQWYKDGQHIIYQIGKNIRVIDMDGSNDVSLVELENDQASKFKWIASGKSLLYSDGDQVKQILIR